MSEINNFFPPTEPYEGESIETLYKWLRSMVEEADIGQLDPLQQQLLLKDIDDLHAHILLSLGSVHHALIALMANHPEVYKEVYEKGQYLNSLV